MRLVTFHHPHLATDEQAGVLQGDRVLAVNRLLGEPAPIGMLELLERGPEVLAALDAAARRFDEEYRDVAEVPVELAIAVWESRLLAPVPRPGSLRDFYAFEEHVATAYAKRGREVPKAWYEVPVFYFGHAGTIVGPDEAVRKPAETNELDFELELACVIGKAGADIPAAEVWDHVAGLTILNDWSARDEQRQEMSVGLGPAKGKDFATSLGPVIVTLDELADRFDGARHDLAMIARINGEEIARGNANTIFWTFPQMIERASRNVELKPGDVIGSGTVGGGCLLELGQEVHAWLQPGDEVELEIERLGRLRNVVA
jgi:2-keto-4-pentenoate hydratase/2-oxohepta-3-ene-1,7-dioic acid hydratase in catechol pathway